MKSSYFCAAACPSSGGNVQRQNELALLPGVVQERRRRHVRRGLLRGLGGDAIRMRAGRAGSVTRCCFRMIFFDLLQPVLIKRQDRVAHHLLLLQFTNHLAIVARW